MATTLAPAAPADPSSRSDIREARRYLYFAAGAAISMFAVGGRWDIALAAWVAPVFLLRFVRDSRMRIGFPLIWLVTVANAFYWSIQLGTPISAPTAVINLIFGTIFALPYVADRLLTPRLGATGRLLIFPAAFASVEFFMGTFSPLGSAFGMRAITQTDNLPVLQFVALLGPYSIGFLINSLATVLNGVWENPADGRSRRAGLIYAAVLALVIVGGGARLAFTPAPDAYVRVAGITPDMHVQQRARALIAGEAGSENSGAAVNPNRSFAGTGLLSSPEEARTAPADAVRAAHALVQDDLLANTRKAARSGARIVAWSETAAPLASEAEKPALLAKAAKVAREEKIYLNLAVGQPFSRNETIMLDPNGKVVWSYDKNYPVPGMEPVMPRKNPVPLLATPFGRLTNVICFDADFPALTRVNADIMIVPGLDWPEIGRTHTLKMSNLRAIENGYALVRIAYHSQSAAFDRLGNVLATQDTTGPDAHIMYADVPTSGSRTIYNRIGDVLGYFSILILIAGIGLALRARRT